MFSIISFIIKLTFSILLSSIFCMTVYNKEGNEKLFFNSILIATMSSSIVATTLLISSENSNFIILISLFIMFLLIFKLYPDFKNQEKLYILNLSILGIILGSGHIFLGIIFLIIIIVLFLYLSDTIKNFLNPVEEIVENEKLD